jgi:hypothetical protein
VTIVSSGFGAGIVTFCMNLWKAELDFRRAKIEELYAAIHMCNERDQIVLQRLAGNDNRVDANLLSMIANVDRIHLIIDL